MAPPQSQASNKRIKLQGFRTSAKGKYKTLAEFYYDAMQNVNHNVRVMLIACLSPNVHSYNKLKLHIQFELEACVVFNGILTMNDLKGDKESLCFCTSLVRRTKMGLDEMLYNLSE